MANPSRAAIGTVALKIADPLSAAKLLRQRHEYWCERVRSWLISQGVDNIKAAPTCDVSWRGERACGKYFTKTHTCRYYLPYVMMLGIEEYDDTIAHEVVHAYQRCLLPRCKYHGESFYIMMKLACGYDLKKHTHCYSVRDAKHVAHTLAPVRKLFEEAGVVV